MNNADGGRARSEQADLRYRILDAARRRGWACDFTSEWVTLTTESTTGRWALADFAADFLGTFDLVATSRQFPANYSAAPAGEYDRYGMHMVHKSG